MVHHLVEYVNYFQLKYNIVLARTFDQLIVSNQLHFFDICAQFEISFFHMLVQSILVEIKRNNNLVDKMKNEKNK